MTQVIGGGRLAGFSRITEHILHNTIRLPVPLPPIQELYRKLLQNQAFLLWQAIENTREIDLKMPAEFIENRRFRQWPFSTERRGRGGASCPPWRPNSAACVTGRPHPSKRILKSVH
jgi:hypothetical protein